METKKTKRFSVIFVSSFIAGTTLAIGGLVIPLINSLVSVIIWVGWAGSGVLLGLWEERQNKNLKGYQWIFLGLVAPLYLVGTGAVYAIEQFTKLLKEEF